MKQRHNTRSCDVPGCEKYLTVQQVGTQSRVHPIDTIYLCTDCQEQKRDVIKQNWSIGCKPKDWGYIIYPIKHNNRYEKCMADFVRDHLPCIHRAITQSIITTDYPTLWFLMISPILRLEEFEFMPGKNLVCRSLLKYRHTIWRHRASPEKLRIIYRMVDEECRRCQVGNCPRRIPYKPMPSKDNRVVCSAHSKIYRRIDQMLYQSPYDKPTSKCYLGENFKLVQDFLDDMDENLLNKILPSTFNPHYWYYRSTVIHIHQAWKSGDLDSEEYRNPGMRKTFFCCWPGCLNSVMSSNGRWCDKHDCMSNFMTTNVGNMFMSKHNSFDDIPSLKIHLQYAEETTGTPISHQWMQWTYMVSELTGMPETEGWTMSWALLLMLEWYCDKEAVDVVLKRTNLRSLQWDKSVYDDPNNPQRGFFSEISSANFESTGVSTSTPVKKMKKWESDWWLTMAAISKTIDICTEQCNSKQGD